MNLLAQRDLRLNTALLVQLVQVVVLDKPGIFALNFPIVGLDDVSFLAPCNLFLCELDQLDVVLQELESAIPQLFLAYLKDGHLKDSCLGQPAQAIKGVLLGPVQRDFLLPVAI